MNLANVANGATTRFIGERSESQIWAGSLVNLANLVNASEHYLVLDMNVPYGAFSKALKNITHILYNTKFD